MKSFELVESFNKTFNGNIFIYQNSICQIENTFFFLVKKDKEKYLVITGGLEYIKKFKAIFIEKIDVSCKSIDLYFISIGNDNITLLSNIFPHLKPIRCNQKRSFGTGDRLGIMTPAHLDAFSKRDIFPVLAQQSVRELIKTKRNWSDVLSSAMLGCFQNGFKNGYGADADHIKEENDLKAAAKVGFSMFTIDSSDYIKNGLTLNKNNIEANFNKYDREFSIQKHYSNKYFVSDSMFNQDSLKDLTYLYYDAIIFIKKCFEAIRAQKNNFDFEVSMDEIKKPLTSIEHFFIVEELTRHGVIFQNFALKFSGKWEKAVDFDGDIEIFKKELKVHMQILKYFNQYKLSLHSGSDKYKVYDIFKDLTNSNFHVKTSGISWLEPLRLIARKDPGIFRKIYKLSLENFEIDKKAYQLSSKVSEMPILNKFQDKDLEQLFNDPKSRQLLHISYGAILNAIDKNGIQIFKDKIFELLLNNEKESYRLVSTIIKKHLNLLIN